MSTKKLEASDIHIGDIILISGEFRLWRGDRMKLYSAKLLIVDVAESFIVADNICFTALVLSKTGNVDIRSQGIHPYHAKMIEVGDKVKVYWSRLENVEIVARAGEEGKSSDT